MLRDTFTEFIEKNPRYTNCAETTMLATSRHYDLGADYAQARFMAGFGGGMACGSVCGALVGAISAIGLYDLKDLGEDAVGADSELLRGHAAKMVEAFEQHFGSTLCHDLQPQYKPFGGCSKLLLETAELLQSVLEEDR